MAARCVAVLNQGGTTGHASSLASAWLFVLLVVGCQLSVVRSIANTTYTVAFEMLSQPSAEWYFIFIIVFVFALVERKNENIESGSTMLPQAKNRLQRKVRH